MREIDLEQENQIEASQVLSQRPYDLPEKGIRGLALRCSSTLPVSLFAGFHTNLLGKPKCRVGGVNAFNLPGATVMKTLAEGADMEDDGDCPQRACTVESDIASASESGAKLRGNELGGIVYHG